MKIAVLTGGGDSSAINAALRGIVFQAKKYGFELVGIKNGWAGLVNAEFTDLNEKTIENTLTRSGTVLGTSRTNPFKMDTVDAVVENIKKAGLDAFITIGGDDTNGVLNRLHDEKDEHINGVGIPQTIDNDILGTEYAVGFDTSINMATTAIDTLRSTAESHCRVMVVEVMGRDAGHIALVAGVAGGAHEILVPEEDFDLDKVCARLKKRHDEGCDYSIVVVAEGAKPKGAGQITQTEKKDAFGHAILGGIGQYLADVIEEKTGIESRFSNLGHLQRGGVPTALDRYMSIRFGVKAVDMIKDGDYGKLVAVVDGKLTSVPLKEGLAENKLIDMDVYHELNGLEYSSQPAKSKA
ncbi:hypothetical protein LCGC14_1181940 [marine sediment metagenome]|uniref:6-phosphofructokinase n=1 Tax=marine sediment metagenome TaxID=412755 RepID=A0A0F9PSB4_9ZZZZ